MTDNQRLTTYQLELLMLVRDGNPNQEEGGAIDFDQLLEMLSWKPTKASCHFSIRALVRRGMLEKTPELMLRRGRQRVGFRLTEAGRVAIDPRDVTRKTEELPALEEAKVDIPGHESEVFE